MGLGLGLGVGVGVGFHSRGEVSLQVKHRSWILSQPQCSAVIAKGDMCTHMPSTLSSTWAGKEGSEWISSG